MISFECFFENHSSNILAAAPHLGQPELAKDYFNQSLLEDPTRSLDEPITPTPQG